MKRTKPLPSGEITSRWLLEKFPSGKRRDLKRLLAAALLHQIRKFSPRQP
jgi:hypothetical protein